MFAAFQDVRTHLKCSQVKWHEKGNIKNQCHICIRPQASELSQADNSPSACEAKGNMLDISPAHLGQFGSRSPMMLQASFSSRVGHSLPPPMGICAIVRARTRYPGDRSEERQVLEQGLHEDQSDVSQSLGITQDWKVKGESSWVQRLQRGRGKRKTQNRGRPMSVCNSHRRNI